MSRPRQRLNMPMVGVGGFSTMEDFYGNVEDDDELERELLRLEAETMREAKGLKAQKKIPQSHSQPGLRSAAAQRGLASLHDIERLAANLNDDVNIDEDDIDENDPDLLGELNEILDSDEDALCDENAETAAPKMPPPRNQVPKNAPNIGASLVRLLEDRLQMYSTAETNAKNAGDTAKARRCSRGIKTLQDQLKSAKAGKIVPEDEIPPSIGVNAGPIPMTAHSSAPSPALVAPAAPMDPSHQPPKAQLPPLPAKPVAPVPVPRAAAPPVPLRTTVLPPIPAPVTVDSTQQILSSRRDEYKKAALDAKKAGDSSAAVKFYKIAKNFDELIAAHSAGKAVDLASLPGPPSEVVLSPGPSAAPKIQIEVAPADPQQPKRPSNVFAAPADSDEDIVYNSEDAEKLFHAPPPPSSILEALLQRLEKYKSAAAKAKEEGDSGKARRMGRIEKTGHVVAGVEQYEDAIRAFKAGKPYDYAELPVPPGFGPMPVPSAEGAPRKGSGAGASSLAIPAGLGSAQINRSAPDLTGATQQKGRSASPLVVAHPRVEPPHVTPSASGETVTATTRRRSSSDRAGGPSPPKVSRQEQQLNFLNERQRLFREAAILAKKQNKTELALSYLKQAKGLDKMIDASKNGLPVNISEVPVPPQLKATAVSATISKSGDAMMPAARRGSHPTPVPSTIVGSREEIFATLEKDLIRQFQICCQNSEYFTKMGDIPKTTLFDKLGADAKRDLAALRTALQYNDAPPIFHYENRNFPVLQCCPDLSDSDLEVGIIRALQVRPPAGYEPKHLDLFVKWTFPCPQEAPPTSKTDCVQGTNCPAWNHFDKLTINRKSRGLLRILKSKSMKFEVFQKGSFLRSDKLLGQCETKLVTLEDHCEIHECIDLMDNRKPCGGKLEIKIRIREPFVQKQFTTVQEKWLVIDEYVRRAKQ